MTDTIDQAEARALEAERDPAPVASLSAAPTDALTISVSEYKTLRRCPRLYRYEYVAGRTPARGPGIEAEWGAALHRGLEQWLTVQQFEGGQDAALGIALNAALSPGHDSAGRPYAPPADPYARAALRAMLRAYADVWGPTDAERYEVLHVELPFDLPVLTRTGRESRGRVVGARREGRIDAVVRDLWTRCAACGATTGSRSDVAPSRCHGAALTPGGVWVVEHKSTGKDPSEPRWIAGIELDLQTATYFDAARLMGLEPAGVLYDVIRRPDFDDPKPAPKLTTTGKERKTPSEACVPCLGVGRIGGPDCQACGGTGRVTKQVAYSNPRFGEPAAAYEERVYQLATTRRGEYFGRRELPIADWQIEEARADMHAAALEVRWRARTGAYPRVGDRYVCAARGRVCPWIDVCGRVESGDDDRLFPLKRLPVIGGQGG